MIRFKKFASLFSLLFIFSFSFTSLAFSHRDWNGDRNTPYIEVNNNEPYFIVAERQNKKAFEKYSDLDSLGRCGVAYANVGKEIMPKDERGDIGSVKPSGWQHNKKSNNNKYPGIVEGNYIYNRCHLIAYSLTGENANKRNLITGTRYLNINGMWEFEEDVLTYVKKTGNHVLYRVTPIYEGSNLVAEGVLMEGWSVEDQGQGICFNVFCFNVQPGIEINYATGENWSLKETTSQQAESDYSSSNKDDTVLITPPIETTTEKTSNESKMGFLVFIVLFIFFFLGGGKGKSNYSSSSNRTSSRRRK